MIIKLKAYGDLQFYTPNKQGLLELEFDHSKVLAEILRHAGIPIEYVGVATIDQVIVHGETYISSDSEIKLYPLVSGG